MKKWTGTALPRPDRFTETHFCPVTFKTYRPAHERPKTGLPRPVSRGWGGHPTPRRAAGPGPARVLVHPSETWSHPRGTLGRCLKGSETNIILLSKKHPLLRRLLLFKLPSPKLQKKSLYFVRKDSIIKCIGYSDNPGVTPHFNVIRKEDTL